LIDKVNDAAKEDNCVKRTEDTENETDSESNSVRVLNQTNTESKKRSVHYLKNNAELKETKETTFLKRITASLDLDLLRDRRYIAIVLGKYPTNSLK
jgi:hypothetical protein